MCFYENVRRERPLWFVLLGDKLMKRYKIKRSLRKQDSIILFVLISLFTILTLVVAIGTRGYKDKQINLICNSMSILGNNQKDQFQQFINNKITILEGLTQYPEIYEMNRQEQESFLKGKAEKFGFNHIFVVGNEGIGFYFDENTIADHREEPFYYDIMEHDTFITEPFIIEDGIITTVSVSIYRDNKKQGVLCGAVLLDEIANMFAEYELVMEGKMFLINRRGHYLVADDETKVTNQVSIFQEKNSDTTLIKEAFADKKDKLGNMVLNGRKWKTHITYLPGFDWSIVQCIDSKMFSKDMNYYDLWRNGSVIIILLIMLCVIRIILHWHRSAAKINIDTLTKCNSRVAMQELIEDLEQEYDKSITIVFFDLNKFKQVNDVYGHDEGDRILCTFSAVLMDTYKDYAQIGRIGGDEFVAIAVDVEEEKIIQLAIQVNQKLQEKEEELKLPCEVSTSYGYASRKKGSKYMLSEIMKLADESMYRYKEEMHKQIKM